MLSDRRDYYKKNKKILILSQVSNKNKFSLLKEVYSFTLCNF
ncbi:hypothetical protein [Borreliella burgdorferi]